MLFIKKYLPGILRTSFCTIFPLIPIFYLIYSLVILLFISANNYQFLLAWYHTNWPDAFDAETIAKNCFTEKWYTYIKQHSLFLMIMVLAGIFLNVFFWKHLFKFSRLFYEECIQVLKFLGASFFLCSKREKIILSSVFGLLIIYRIYFFISFPLHTDEVASYLFFAKQGFIITSTNYPIPNNHIFFNIICAALSKLQFLTPKLVMRLPSMLGELILWYGLFCLIKRWSTFERALVVLAGVAFNFIISYYATQGRGYQFQEICTIISMLGCWSSFFLKTHKQFGYSLFIVACIVGFYISPLFIFQFVILCIVSAYLFLRDKQYRQFGLFIKGSAYIGLAVVILYLPLIFSSSLNALINSSNVAGESTFNGLMQQWGDFKFGINYILNYSSLGWYVLLAGVALSFILFIRKKITGEFYNYAYIYFISSCIGIVLLIIVKKTFPPERALCFWILIIDIVFINVCYDALKRFFPGKYYFLIWLFISLKVITTLRILYWDKYAIHNKEMSVIYNDLQKDFRQLTNIKPRVWQITDSDDFYSMYLRLYLEQQNLPSRIVLERGKSVGDIIFLPDIYKSNFQLEGYYKWQGKKMTYFGDFMEIYISDKMLN